MASNGTEGDRSQTWVSMHSGSMVEDEAVSLFIVVPEGVQMQPVDMGDMGKIC